jgi:hypothetical protein
MKYFQLAIGLFVASLGIIITVSITSVIAVGSYKIILTLLK